MHTCVYLRVSDTACNSVLQSIVFVDKSQNATRRVYMHASVLCHTVSFSKVSTMPQRHTAGLFFQRKREAEEVYDRMYFVSYVCRLSLAEAYAAVLSRDGTLPFSLPQHRRATEAATEATHPLSQDESSANSCIKTLTLTEIVSAKWLNSLLNQHYTDIHKAFKCKCI